MNRLIKLLTGSQNRWTNEMYCTSDIEWAEHGGVWLQKSYDAESVCILEELGDAVVHWWHLLVSVGPCQSLLAWVALCWPDCWLDASLLALSCPSVVKSRYGPLQTDAVDLGVVSLPLMTQVLSSLQGSLDLYKGVLICQWYEMLWLVGNSGSVLIVYSIFRSKPK